VVFTVRTAAKKPKTVARFARRSKKGKTATKFSGLIGKTSLSPGRYRLTLVATDAAGNASKAVTVKFTVARR
jgi:hypothetical protein